MLNFTSSERRTILIISLVLIVSAGFQFLRPSTVYLPQIDYRESDSIFTRYSHQSPQNMAVDLGKEDSVQYVRLEKRAKPTTINKQFTLDINSATAEEFTRLPRIGPSIAKRIIAYRSEYGPFRSVNDLMKVKGIGTKTLDKIKPFLLIDAK